MMEPTYVDKVLTIYFIDIFVIYKHLKLCMLGKDSAEDIFKYISYFS